MIVTIENATAHRVTLTPTSAPVASDADAITLAPGQSTSTALSDPSSQLTPTPSWMGSSLEQGGVDAWKVQAAITAWVDGAGARLPSALHNAAEVAGTGVLFASGERGDGPTSVSPQRSSHFVVLTRYDAEEDEMTLTLRPGEAAPASGWVVPLLILALVASLVAVAVGVRHHFLHRAQARIYGGPSRTQYTHDMV